MGRVIVIRRWWSSLKDVRRNRWISALRWIQENWVCSGDIETYGKPMWLLLFDTSLAFRVQSQCVDDVIGSRPLKMCHMKFFVELAHQLSSASSAINIVHLWIDFKNILPKTAVNNFFTTDYRDLIFVIHFFVIPVWMKGLQPSLF